MRIAITGAAGRVGRHVVEHALAEGHDLVTIDRASFVSSDGRITHVRADVTDYGQLLGALDGCDALIHLAAIPGPGFLPDAVVHDTNVISSYHALIAATEVDIPRVCQASSVNAIGGRFSQWPPRYDYFPLDEEHPSYAIDAYSLSKWVCEQQADAIVRGHPAVTIASLRLHGVVEGRSETTEWLGTDERIAEKQLWGYVGGRSVARAFLAAITAPFEGHEVFYIVAPRTMTSEPSDRLAATFYPKVPLRRALTGTEGFFDCSKAHELLGWVHDDA